jgi:trk/ktr system potassium uptake protein
VNRRPVFLTLGLIIMIIGGSMFFPVFCALIYQGEDIFSLLVAAVVTLAIGYGFIFLGKQFKKPKRISKKVPFIIVSLGWILASLFGALPYYFYAHLPRPIYSDAPQKAGYKSNKKILITNCKDPEKITGQEFCSFTNCFFESSSGFTTTGATILKSGLWKDPQVRSGLPHGLLLWRGLTQWLGGMGIIVLGLAVFPLLGVGQMGLYKAEVPGPSADKIAPKLGDTAKLLWIVYALITLIEILLLFPVIGLYQAIANSFTTMATGGFSPVSDSIGGFNSPYVEYIITFFMIVAGVNFALSYFVLIRRDFRPLKNDGEFKSFILMFIISSFLITFAILGYKSWGFEEAFRKAIFQTASIVTTTGFATTDFNLWVGLKGFIALAPATLLLLMFVGASAGSTGGGPKVIRYILMMKTLYRDLLKIIHPKISKVIHYNKKPVSEDMLSSISGFFIVYLLIFVVGFISISAYGSDIVTSVTASISALGNTGPGFGDVGPMNNWGHFADPLKWLLSLMMIMGRLEVFTLVVLFLPEFWKN